MYIACIRSSTICMQASTYAFYCVDVRTQDADCNNQFSSYFYDRFFSIFSRDIIWHAHSTLQCSGRVPSSAENYQDGEVAELSLQCYTVYRKSAYFAAANSWIIYLLAHASLSNLGLTHAWHIQQHKQQQDKYTTAWVKKGCGCHPNNGYNFLSILDWFAKFFHCCKEHNRACKLFNIHLYATLCFNYFRWYRRMFLYGSVFELLIC